MTGYKEGDREEFGGRMMVCVPENTSGRMYRKGAYWLYTDASKTPMMTKKDMQYFRDIGEKLRVEREFWNKNQPVAISDTYVKDDDVLIGGRKWWVTKHVTVPAEEAGKKVRETASATVIKGKEAVKGISGGGGIVRSLQVTAVVAMLFIAAIIYIVFVKGKGASGMTVGQVG